jgi:HD superfamily phosphodiesterase
MNYDYQKIREEVGKLVEEACLSRDNEFGNTVWEYHIMPVVEHSLELGKKLGADLEILELAALLHDYSAIVDAKFYEDHHMHSGEMAEDILSRLDYDGEKIKHIKECILNHRGSKERNHKSKESEILASADAMAHFSQVVDMFYLTFRVHKYDTREGAVWLKNKLGRSWEKIMPEGKELVRENRRMVMKILDKTINC